MPVIHRSKLRLLACAVSALALGSTLPVLAQPGASNTITIVVPGGPGGTPDLIARQVGEAITKHTGKTVVVENKMGAGGSIGGRAVMQAKPDGATLLITSSGTTGTASHIYPNYHPLEKLDHVTMLVEVPFVMVARGNFPTATPQAFLEHVRKNPGQVRWSNAGQGTHGNITQVLLEQAGKMDLDLIPYKGSMPAYNDLLGGHVDAAMDNAAVYKAAIDAGKVKPIFVTSKQRMPALPKVATARELGIPFDNMAWYALAAPKGTPKAVYDEIQAALLKYFDTTANRAQYAANGMHLQLSTVAEAQKRADTDTAAFGKVIKALKMDVAAQ